MATDTKQVVPTRRPDVITLTLVSAHFAIFVAPLALAAAWGPGWWLVPLWLWYGVLSQGVILVLHEMCHKLLLRRVRLNEFLARWVVSPYFFSDFDSFRKRHFDHHRVLGQAEDPKYTYRMDISGWRFVAFVLQTVTLWEAVRRVAFQAGSQSRKTAQSSKRAFVGVVLVQTGLVLTLLAVARGTGADWPAAAIHVACAYFIIHIYGLASLGVLLFALRGIIEHRPCGGGEPRVGEAALRNFSDGFLQRLIFGAYGFSEHATHHEHPAVPYYRLAEVTAELSVNNPALRPLGGHVAVLRRLVTARLPKVQEPETGR